MILLTSNFSENFENPRNDETMIQENYEKNCYDPCFGGESECVKMYHEEYIEVFSPTVFETVEVHTSSSSEKSENSVDPNPDSSFGEAEKPHSNSDSTLNEISLNSIDTVSSLENLEPGTYTLDVLEPGDFDFDPVFVNSTSDFPSDLVAFGEDCRADEADSSNQDAEKSGENGGGCKKAYYKLKTYRNSSRKPVSPKYAAKNVSAREFVNNFSSDLGKSETSTSKNGAEDEGRSLSWLLDFKVSSIFHPVESG